MSRLIDSVEIEYPESDGQPMGETDLHRCWMVRILDQLLYRYRTDAETYVTGDLLLYYVEGEPKRFIVPDAFVAKGCPDKLRRIFKLWEENASPQFALEVTSLSTRRRYERVKPEIYGKIGIAENFIYDLTSDYLDPPLQGFRLVDGEYVRIEPNADGRLEAREIGITLRLAENPDAEAELAERIAGGWDIDLVTRNELVLEDAVTGERLPTAAEGERSTRIAAEAEVARLRRLLDARSPNARSSDPTGNP